MKGTWAGYYRYDNKKVQKALGFDETNFTINIESVENSGFIGTIRDDIATGGMDGKGRIIGNIKDDNVYFRKYMPMGSTIDRDGNHNETGRKHSTLYYSGILFNDKKQVKGIWKFRYTIDWLFGFIPIPYRPGKGTWEMNWIEV